MDSQPLPDYYFKNGEKVQISLTNQINSEQQNLPNFTSLNDLWQTKEKLNSQYKEKFKVGKRMRMSKSQLKILNYYFK